MWDNYRYAEKSGLTNAAKDVIQSRIVAEDKAADDKGVRSIYRPLVGITESSNLYDAVSIQLPSIKSPALVAITDYYRSIMDQRQISDAIASDAFLCITADSRCQIIDELWNAFEESSRKAKRCLACLDESYPNAWFTPLRLDDVGSAQGELLFFRYKH